MTDSTRDGTHKHAQKRFTCNINLEKKDNVGRHKAVKCGGGGGRAHNKNRKVVDRIHNTSQGFKYTLRVLSSSAPQFSYAIGVTRSQGPATLPHSGQ